MSEATDDRPWRERNHGAVWGARIGLIIVLVIMFQQAWVNRTRDLMEALGWIIWVGPLIILVGGLVGYGVQKTRG